MHNVLRTLIDSAEDIKAAYEENTELAISGKLHGAILDLIESLDEYNTIRQDEWYED